MAPVRIAIVGLGKIARTRHVPALAEVDGVALAATVDPAAPPLPDVPHFDTLAALLRSSTAIDAVALCTPPQVRVAVASEALRAGKHVLLEKPPAASVGEAAPLTALAQAAGRSLFATWHSRFAPGVAPARRLLEGRRPLGVTINWKEDVDVWHPGQDWIFETGGFGVFDPGINALSILTAIVPGRLSVTSADLHVPVNRKAPIAADLAITDGDGLAVTAAFDFRQRGEPCWTIDVLTDRGTISLSRGGARLTDGETVIVDEPKAEYQAIYRRFRELAGSGGSDVDLSPLQLVADAFVCGRSRPAAAFDWRPAPAG